MRGCGSPATQAATLIEDLVDLGVPGIHLYTLNVPEAVEGVLGRLGDGFFAAAA